MSSRWVRFLLAILCGLALGVLYGWVISPVEYVDTTPDTLRADYRLDYVLMTAEIYHSEQDLDLAARRLALLGSAHPSQIAAEALVTATHLGSPEADRLLVQSLAAALLNWEPSPGGGAP
ncbi:MAG: hypothetical protein FJZ96_12380 [Chloroflexi bacterium]|nr:hypothetical protein [Chloroflexota bacterium]